MFYHKGWTSVRRGHKGEGTESAINGEEVYSKEVEYSYDLGYEDIRLLFQDEVELLETVECFEQAFDL